MNRKLLVAIISGFIFTNSICYSQTLQHKQGNIINLLKRDTLKESKAFIDSLFKHDKKKLIVLVKVPNSRKTIEVKNEKWPKEIDSTYNILKDPNGHVVFFLETEYNESGDWNMVYYYYFDKDGKTFAFSRQNNFFNSGCTEVAYETINEYYDKEFKRVRKEYKLVDRKGKSLKRAKCELIYDEPYKVEPNNSFVLKLLKSSNLE